MRGTRLLTSGGSDSIDIVSNIASRYAGWYPAFATGERVRENNLVLIKLEGS
jgi:hypothetical protein